MKVLTVKDGTLSAHGPLAVLLFPFFAVLWLMQIVVVLLSLAAYFTGWAVVLPFMAIGRAGALLGRRGATEQKGQG